MDQLKDREIRMLGSTARANNFFVIVVSVMFVNVITAAMVTAGYQSISLALIIIFANLFMFLAASGAMDDLKAFSMDMDDEEGWKRLSLEACSNHSIETIRAG